MAVLARRLLMALAAGSLVFVAYSGAAPNGTALGTLTDAYEKTVSVEDDGIGGGSFSIHPTSSQAAWATQGNYVKVWRDTVSGAPIAGFWIEEGGDVVLSPDEDGGLAWKRGGRGPIARLAEAIAWHTAISGGSGAVRKVKGEWSWKDAHPGRVLVRLLEEAQARGVLSEVSWDFTRTKDSSGVAWSTDAAQTYRVPIGMDLLTLVGELRDTGLYVRMDPDFSLHAWDAYDNDLSGSIAFTAGTNIRETSERRVEAQRSRSTLLVEGSDKDSALHYRKVHDSALQTALGRRKEGFFRFGRTSTWKMLKRVGERKLSRWKVQHDGLANLGVIDTTGAVALVDYIPGDTVTVDIPGEYTSSAQRVAAVTLVETENGEYDPILDFGDLGHDPVTGRSLGGDSSAAGCCGGDRGTGGGGRGRGGSVDTTSYVLDDFSRSVTPGTWGTIPQGLGVDTEAPWEGGNVWTLEVSSGAGKFALSGGVATIEITANASLLDAFLSSDTYTNPNGEPWGPWADADAVLTFEWKVNLLGTLTDTDPNRLQFEFALDGWDGILYVNLGDDVTYGYMSPKGQRGIVVAQKVSPVYSSFVPVTLVADTWYKAKVDIRGTRVRAKLWQSSDAEPVAWDIDVAKVSEPLVLDSAEMYVALEGNTTGGNMKLSVRNIDAKVGGSGASSLPPGDGSTTTWTIEEWEAGSLRVWVDGIATEPASVDRSAGTFTFDRAPAVGAYIRAEWTPV